MSEGGNIGGHICLDLLSEVVSYDPETGEMFWRPRKREMFTSDQSHRSWNGKHALKPALTAKNRKGYRHGSICGFNMSAHRVAWAIHYGAHPGGLIDHINGDPSDNRIVNLRIATPEMNAQNRIWRAQGVSIGRDGLWTAKIYVNRKAVVIGKFCSRAAASTAGFDARSTLYPGFVGRAV